MISNFGFLSLVHKSSIGIFGSALDYQEHQGNFNSISYHGKKERISKGSTIAQRFGASILVL
jgi:hypothetical protein